MNADTILAHASTKEHLATLHEEITQVQDYARAALLTQDTLLMVNWLDHFGSSTAYQVTPERVEPEFRKSIASHLSKLYAEAMLVSQEEVLGRAKN